MAHFFFTFAGKEKIMAELYFDVHANYEEVIRLREECKRLEDQILATARATGSLNGTEQLQKDLTEATEKLNGLVDNAAKAGAEMKNELANGLKESSQSAEKFFDVISSVKEGLSDYIESRRKSGEIDDQTAEKLNRLVGLFSIVQTGLNAIKKAQSAANAQTTAGAAATASYATMQATATTATNAATVATKGLNAAISANPIGIALSVLPMAISLINQFTNGNGDATLSTAEFNAEVNKEIGHLDDLIDVINSTNSGTKSHRSALEEVNGICKEYNVTLLDENDTLEQQKKKYEALTVAIREATAEKIREKYIDNARTTAGNINEGSLKKLKKAAKRATYHEVNSTGLANNFYKSDTLRNTDDAVWELFAAQAQQISDNLKELSGEEYRTAFDNATRELSVALTGATGASQKEVEGFQYAIKNYLTEVTNTAKALDQRERKINTTAGAFNPVKLGTGATGNQLNVDSASFDELEAEWNDVTRATANAMKNTYEDVANDALRETNQYLNQQFVDILKERNEEVVTALKEKATSGTRGELKERKRRLEKEIDDLAEDSEQLEVYMGLVKAIDAELKSRKGPSDNDVKKTDRDADKAAQNQLKRDTLNQRLAELSTKQEKVRTRASIDLMHETEQARIDTMEEGTAKTLDQMALDHAKELEQLRRNFEDLRDEKIKQAKELYEADVNNYDDKGKLKSPFTYNYDDEAFEATEQESKAYNAQLQASESKYLRERTKVLLGQYKDYSTQRLEIEKKYNDDIALLEQERGKASEQDQAKYDAAIIQAKKDKNSELFKLDMQNNDELKKALGDVSKMTIEEVSNSIDVLEKYLSETKDLSVEDIEVIKNALKSLRNVAEDFSLDGLMKNFSKAIGNGGKNGLLAQVKVLKAAWAGMKPEERFSAVAGWVGNISDGLNTAAGYMQQIADAAKNSALADSAEMLGSVASLGSSIAQGAAQGGWIGAIAGGVTNIVGQMIDSFAQASAEEAEMAKNAKDFANALKQASLTVKETDFSSIFGVDKMGLAQAYGRKAVESLNEYDAALTEINKKYDDFNEKTKWFGSSLRATVKGFEGLQTMRVKTKDRSWWDNFWGKGDEYTMLGDLAPELWKDGVLDIDALQLFLETNTQITEEQRDQLQNLVDINKAYEENKKALEDYLSSMFGNLASDLAEATIQGMRDGSEIGSEYMRQNMTDVIGNLEKQLVSNVYNSYLSQYQKRFMEVIEGGGDETDLLGIYAEMFSGMEETQKKAVKAAEMFEEQSEKYGFSMSKMEEEFEESATTGSFKGMNQQMGAALEGRFTAVQISNEGIREQATFANAKLDVMMLKAMDQVRIAEDIRNAQADALVELQAINRNTKPLASMAEEISTIRSKVERL